MKTARWKTSFTLTVHGLRLLRQLASNAGLSMSAYLETLIRAKAKEERVEEPS